jgi:ParB-like chromosome segregation protein Spo0J
VPVHVADNLTPAQVKAYRLMDNRSHDETSFDLELLGPELEEVNGLDFDLDLTGFAPGLTDAEIASVVSYVRSRFGGVNTPISAATVGQIRAANHHRREYWTVAELLTAP